LDALVPHWVRVCILVVFALALRRVDAVFRPFARAAGTALRVARLANAVRRFEGKVVFTLDAHVFGLRLVGISVSLGDGLFDLILCALRCACAT